MDAIARRAGHAALSVVSAIAYGVSCVTPRTRRMSRRMIMFLLASIPVLAVALDVTGPEPRP